jgi:hypothetical protein
MIDRTAINKTEKVLREYPGASFSFSAADEVIDRDQFVVGIPVPPDLLPLPMTVGYGNHRAWGIAATLDGAICIALSRIDALTQAEAA